MHDPVLPIIHPSDITVASHAFITGSTAELSLANWDNKTVVVKAPFQKNFKKFEKEFDTELKTLAPLSHPNIIILEGILKESIGFSLVFEYMKEGDLLEYLSLHSYDDSAKNPARDTILEDVLLGLVFLAHCGIVHRDIKGENILLCKKNKALRAKISDFGLARQVDPSTRVYKSFAFAGTYAYAAPEMCYPDDENKFSYSEKTDMYALGLVYLQLASDMVVRPYGDQKRENVFAMIFAGTLPDIPATVVEPTRSRIHWCLSYQPQERPSAQALLEKVQKAKI